MYVLRDPDVRGECVIIEAEKGILEIKKYRSRTGVSRERDMGKL